MARQENKGLWRFIGSPLEEAEMQTRITEAKHAEEKEKLREENRVLKQALAGVESAIALSRSHDHWRDDKQYSRDTGRQNSNTCAFVALNEYIFEGKLR